MQDRLYMHCPYGNIQWNPADLGWGFNRYENNDRNRCIRQDLESKEIDSAILEKIVTENCTDQKSCIIPIPEVLKDLGRNQNQSSTIFIQYSCEQTKEQAREKFVKLAKISSIQILVISFFAVTIRFLKKQARINESHY